MAEPSARLNVTTSVFAAPASVRERMIRSDPASEPDSVESSATMVHRPAPALANVMVRLLPAAVFSLISVSAAVELDPNSASRRKLQRPEELMYPARVPKSVT